MSQLLKNYKAPSVELICKVIEARIVKEDMFDASDAVKTWYKDMLNDGYLVTFSKNDVPIEWYDDEGGNESNRLFTGHQTKEWGVQTAYYWERTVKDNEYLHNKMIKTVKAWEEIEQQVKMFLRHNKCIIIQDFNTEKVYNRNYEDVIESMEFNNVDKSYYNDWFEQRNCYYEIDTLESLQVFDISLKERDYKYYRDLTIFAYFKPQSVQFTTFINGKNVKEKVNVGDYWVNYHTDVAYQESEDFLGNRVLRGAEHPHIADGRVCAGGWSQAWNECRNLGRIFGWHSGYSLFLRRYNSRSPYNMPLLFKTDFKMVYGDENDDKEVFEYQFNSPAEAIKVMKERNQVFGGSNLERLFPHLKRCKHNNISAMRYFEAFNLLKRINTMCSHELRHVNKSKAQHLKEIYQDIIDYIRNTYDVRDYEIVNLELNDNDYFGKAILSLWKDCGILRTIFADGRDKSLKPTLKQILLACRGHYSKNKDLAKMIKSNNQMRINTLYSNIVKKYSNYELRMFTYAKRRALKAAQYSIKETRDFVNTLKSVKKDSNYRIINELFKDFETKLDRRGQQI